MQQQIHVPTDDIPPPAPTTTTRSSHERNLLVPYARTDVYKYSFFPHAASLWNKLHKTIKRLNHWIFLSLEYNYILIIN